MLYSTLFKLSYLAAAFKFQTTAKCRMRQCACLSSVGKLNIRFCSTHNFFCEFDFVLWPNFNFVRLTVWFGFRKMIELKPTWSNLIEPLSSITEGSLCYAGCFKAIREIETAVFESPLTLLLAQSSINSRIEVKNSSKSPQRIRWC